MKVRSLDHLVLTVASIEATCAFYTDVLGMDVEIFAEGRRHALRFGDQKINLHAAGNEFEPKADRATPGSGDLCFLTDTPVEELVTHLESMDIEIIQGPVPRTGATGPIISVYFRDPDGNLIEVANADE
ncbi:MAG: VOC family protein [Rhodospirillaceae bacterium]|jgi:catechol 2,3-dioxygenase-like lactoylglutathione lyase family enzyme|nr:VOC family protein [Rhodospirillaceae bacterium]MBT3810938.1 VOC family protein [Rhodospirillaceae bacterium]MBT3932111.1 VOC family protein [Rhodospirillaceae bacterium]MBT4773018.1 VOC family protein [Rhodospirillaceae bacterium]MBT5359048.1 VOC family protein [Rhodospirillaceae bacterium]